LSHGERLEVRAPENGCTSGLYSIDDSSVHSVTVNVNQDCAAAVAPLSLQFNDTPLTNISAHAESQAAGGTQSSINCVDSNGNPVGNSPEPDSGFADPVTASANGLAPGTYTCTIVIDPCRRGEGLRALPVPRYLWTRC